jgi:putative methionine-R-sulfoxide reductase with GAF domain
MTGDDMYWSERWAIGAFIFGLVDVESKRVDEFANMSDEELRQYVYGIKEGVSFS